MGLRIALISTPRSGNTWFRKLLCGTYQVPEGLSHELGASEMVEAPPEVIHQVHWRRSPEFVEQLHEHGFRVVTLARHPFDVLISVLHFCRHDSSTANWLLGQGGDELGLLDATPRSQAFLDYATGPRAAALLAVTADWWGQPDVLSVRYEDVVADPVGQLQALAPALGPPRCESIDDVVAACSLGELRKTVTNHHYWQGQPGLWRSLLTSVEVAAIAPVLRPVVDHLRYSCDLPASTADEADAAWARLVCP